jgi:hypothetical protein
MRFAATVLAVVMASGCASRQDPPTTAAGLPQAPINYETTVTTYFDLTSRTPPAQRKLSFGAPEASGCRMLGNIGAPGGWVVPVTYQASPPPAPPVAAAPVTPPVVAAPAPSPKAPVVASKGKSKGKQKAASTPVAPAAAPTMVAAVTVPAPLPPGAVALDEVSVTGNQRYFFWFNKETINAVTRRMDVCP